LEHVENFLNKFKYFSCLFHDPKLIHMDKSMYLKAIQSIYDDNVMDFPMVQKKVF
jgi:hypothetical protein